MTHPRTHILGSEGYDMTQVLYITPLFYTYLL